MFNLLTKSLTGLAFLDVLNGFAVNVGPPVHSFEPLHCCTLAKEAIPFMGFHKELAINSEMSSLDFWYTFLVATFTNFCKLA
ncbi:hypothetical protein DSO57_1007512 [Entomophthora muscae]|uniref:Uncharacterized protein n=1 Tax=Entomophthora muscae TaxID=34485 RepID=A0ACC2UGF9_9FUNG|nr:hypothetical protein DSO57_1007512 [Entomophthora muscae]